jgi:pilus assembly protein CpaB
MPLRRPHISPFTALLVGAILFGILVAWLVMHTLQSREAAAAAALRARMEKNRVTVVVPTRNLKPGAIADSSDMATRAVPRSVIYPQTITAADWAGYDGRVITHPAYQGRPMLSTDFGPVVSNSFAGELAPGERAVTIDVSGVNSIAGLLQPGNRIDILFLASGPEGPEELPLLRHVRVLATGAHTTAVTYVSANGNAAAPAHFSSITLALTPSEVAKVTLAEQVGSLRVALIPQHHPRSGPVPPLLKGDLFGVSTRPTVQTPPTVQYILGSPGENQVQELPLAMPLPAAAHAQTAPGLPAQEQKELQALTRLVHAASPAVSHGTPLHLPKGYP